MKVIIALCFILSLEVAFCYPNRSTYDKYFGDIMREKPEIEANDDLPDPYYHGAEKEEAAVQGISADTKYRLLHQHCDARGSLNPPQRYYLRPAATGETRWGVSTCGYCDNTKIHFSGSGREVRSGSEVSIVASNDMVLDCDQGKCPINYNLIRFKINKCGGRDGDAININDAVMFYTTYNGKRCQVSFNRADPFLWCPGTPLAEPPTDYDCNNSCGTVVFVQSG